MMAAWPLAQQQRTIICLDLAPKKIILATAKIAKDLKIKKHTRAAIGAAVSSEIILFKLIKYVFYKCISKNKFILITILDEKICVYLSNFLINFNNSKSNSLAGKLDYSLDFLIVKIYNEELASKNINSWVFYILAFSIYILTDNKDIALICLYQILFLIGTSITLIVIIKRLIENEDVFKDLFPLLYYILKYCLVCLLILNLCTLVIIGQSFFNLLVSHLKNYLLKTDVITKLKEFKTSLDYKRFKNFNPKDPKDPNSNNYWSPSKKHKNKRTSLIDRELSTRATAMKEKFFAEISADKIIKEGGDTTNTNLKHKQVSFSEKRNWGGRLDLSDLKPNLTTSAVLKNINEEKEAYDIQEKHFKNIVINIGKRKENFYADESRVLFTDYVKVVKILKENLKSLEDNLNNSSKK